MIRQREDEDGWGRYASHNFDYDQSWDLRTPVRREYYIPDEPSEPWSIWHALGMVAMFAAGIGFWVVFAVGVYAIARWW